MMYSKVNGKEEKHFIESVKYNIIQVESTKYKGEETEWKNIFNPKKNEKRKKNQNLPV